LFAFLFFFFLISTSSCSEEKQIVGYKLCPGLHPACINVAQKGFTACSEKNPYSLIVAIVVNRGNPNIVYDGKPLLHHTKDKRCTECLLRYNVDINALGRRKPTSKETNALEYHVEEFFFAHFDSSEKESNQKIEDECSVISSLVPHYEEYYRETLEKRWQRMLKHYEKKKIFPRENSLQLLSLELTALLLPVSAVTLELVD